MLELPIISPARARRIKEALRFRCEWCDAFGTQSTLEIHTLPPRPGGSVSPDPQKRFLVLCRDCHRDVHAVALPYQIQMDLVRRRPAELKHTLRRIFGYRPPPYSPPGEFDLSEIYEECFSMRSLDLFRAGG